ncbi:MAG: hypothetical protein PHD21_00185 [Flavobacteriales bacterium]|nr:hypothetical protein [Flavobacteriales bacterium]
MSSSAVYKYLAGKQTNGALSSSSDRETEMSYAEKAVQAKREEDNLIKKIMYKLENLYSGYFTGNSINYIKLEPFKIISLVIVEMFMWIYRENIFLHYQQRKILTMK